MTGWIRYRSKKFRNSSGMLYGNSDENGNAIRDYDTAKRIRRRVTLQQKQFKDYSICNQLLLNIL